MNDSVTISLPRDLWKSVKSVLDTQNWHLSFAASQATGAYKEMVEFEAYACQSLIEVLEEELEFNP